MAQTHDLALILEHFMEKFVHRVHSIGHTNFDLLEHLIDIVENNFFEPVLRRLLKDLKNLQQQVREDNAP